MSPVNDLNRLISEWMLRQRAFGDLKYSQVELCTNKSHKLDQYQYSLKPITENLFNNDWNLNILLLNRLFQMATNLECLHFSCLDDENSINEKLIITILGSLPKLTCLSFGIGLQISSKSWNLIVNQLGGQLQHLQINRVNYLTLENIVKKCSNLVSLYIRFCPSSVGCISYLCPKLRKLRIQSMATIYLRNALFTDRSRQMSILDNEDDEETINLAMNDENENNNNLRINQHQFREFGPLNNNIINRNRENLNHLSSRAERYLNDLNNIWYLNLVELRLNRITVKSLTVIFNHCISLQVLDIVLYFNRTNLVFENQDFIQLSHRLTNMRLFALDVFCKWNLIQLDRGLALMLAEWPKIEVIIIKRGLITENLFNEIKQNCKNLKVISVEFSDFIPYNHRLDEITDRVVDSLVEFSKLTKLRLHFCGITDSAVIRLIDCCKSLKYLDLYGCIKITGKSYRAICIMLNIANRCNAIFLNRNTDQESRIKQRSCLRKRSTDSESIQSLEMKKLNDSHRSINFYLYSCKQFDTVYANCIDCNKKPKTFLFVRKPNETQFKRGTTSKHFIRG